MKNIETIAQTMCRLLPVLEMKIQFFLVSASGMWCSHRRSGDLVICAVLLSLVTDKFGVATSYIKFGILLPCFR